MAKDNLLAGRAPWPVGPSLPRCPPPPGQNQCPAKIVSTALCHNQSQAIALNLRELAGLTVPVVAVITGEGGSGGALALGVANRVLMLENSVYSVISPEGCAAILWRTRDKAADAAKALKITVISSKVSSLGKVSRI